MPSSTLIDYYAIMRNDARLFAGHSECGPGAMYAIFPPPLGSLPDKYSPSDPLA